MDSAESSRMPGGEPDNVLFRIQRGLCGYVSAAAGLDRDSELARLIETLAALLPPPADTVSQNVRVTDQRNIARAAGRNLIRTEKFVRRNTITSDEHHLTLSNAR